MYNERQFEEFPCPVAQHGVAGIDGKLLGVLIFVEVVAGRLCLGRKRAQQQYGKEETHAVTSYKQKAPRGAGGRKSYP